MINHKILIQFPVSDKVSSRFRVDEMSQISERYCVQMKAPMKQKRSVMLGQICKFAFLQISADFVVNLDFFLFQLKAL